jgi:ribosomal-protein-alanine N-acetyltransferase
MKEILIPRTELHTPRLLLRPFQVNDVADALHYRNDEEFARFLRNIRLPFTLQDAEAFVKQNISEPWERFPTFAIVFESRLIGTVNFNVEMETRVAMLGYAIGREWWGRGITTEAASAAISWAIQAFSLVRIWASTDIRNVRSQKVLKKLGFKREELRVDDHVGRNGEMIDEVVYGLNLAYGKNSTSL